jgi:hypothetical protein
MISIVPSPVVTTPPASPALAIPETISLAAVALYVPPSPPAACTSVGVSTNVGSAIVSMRFSIAVKFEESLMTASSATVPAKALDAKTPKRSRRIIAVISVLFISRNGER